MSASPHVATQGLKKAQKIIDCFVIYEPRDLIAGNPIQWNIGELTMPAVLDLINVGHFVRCREKCRSGLISDLPATQVEPICKSFPECSPRVNHLMPVPIISFLTEDSFKRLNGFLEVGHKVWIRIRR